MQITTRITQISATASMAAARQHTSLVDRPVSKGGSDRGPMGGELLLMGVGGCFMSNLLGAAAARSITVTDLAVDISAELEGTPARFTTITLKISGGGADPVVMAELVSTAEAGCIAINTIKHPVAVILQN